MKRLLADHNDGENTTESVMNGIQITVALPFLGIYNFENYFNFKNLFIFEAKKKISAYKLF